MTARPGFRAAERGAVNLEFMLWLPLLLLWLGGCLTAFDAFRAHNLAERAATAVSDVVARLEEVDDRMLEDLVALQRAIAPRARSHRLRAASIRFDDGAHLLDWRWSSDPSARLALHEIDLSALPPMAQGETVIYTETQMRHVPVLNIAFGARTWTLMQVAKPRYATALRHAAGEG